jgi:hypothetical protein
VTYELGIEPGVRNRSVITAVVLCLAIAGCSTGGSSLVVGAASPTSAPTPAYDLVGPLPPDLQKTYNNNEITLTSAPDAPQISAAEAFESYKNSGMYSRFSVRGFPPPKLGYGLFTDTGYGEASKGGEVTPTYVDRLSWFVIYPSVLWTGGGGPGGPIAAASTKTTTAVTELSDVIVVIDGRTGAFLLAVTRPSVPRSIHP